MSARVTREFLESLVQLGPAKPARYPPALAEKPAKKIRTSAAAGASAQPAGAMSGLSALELLTQQIAGGRHDAAADPRVRIPDKPEKKKSKKAKKAEEEDIEQEEPRSSDNEEPDSDDKENVIWTDESSTEVELSEGEQEEEEEEEEEDEDEEDESDSESDANSGEEDEGDEHQRTEEELKAEEELVLERRRQEKSKRLLASLALPAAY